MNNNTDTEKQIDSDFQDRRKQQRPLDQPCRRGFNASVDSNPWWLKANYLAESRPKKNTKKEH
ncbi:MAG: hypothetical protein ACJA0N_000803 [Pseudohongiellaceae bacterium]|jgi:hypothetical protein